MESNLFTVILDFDGGTYISQGMGLIDEAFREALSEMKIDGINSDEVVDFDTPTNVEGLENVWCVTGLIHAKLALFHIVKTTPQ